MHEYDTEIAYRGAGMPAPPGERPKLLHGVDDGPEPFGDWVTASAGTADRDDVEVALDAFCTLADAFEPARAVGRVA